MSSAATEAVPASAWHYTSLAALNSIIDSGILRFSHVSQSNDSRELVIGLEELIRYSLTLTNKRKSDSRQMQAHMLIGGASLLDFDGGNLLHYIRDIAQKVSGVMDDTDLMEAVEKAVNGWDGKERQLRPYQFSLSKDHDSLDLWRSYGDDGRGVSIEFDLDYLESAVSGCSVTPRGVRKRFNVLYDEYALLAPIVALFESAISSGPFTKENAANIGEKSNELFSLAFCRKHASFRSEKEVKLVAFYNKLFRYEGGPMPTPVLTAQGIKEIYKVNIDVKAAIKSIVIGPKSAVSPAALRELYTHPAFAPISGCEISQSESPLR